MNGKKVYLKTRDPTIILLNVRKTVSSYRGDVNIEIVVSPYVQYSK